MKYKLNMYFGKPEDDKPTVKHKILANEDIDIESGIAEFERKVFDKIEEWEDEDESDT